MTYWLCIGLFGLALSAAAAQAKSVALLIGVGDYMDEQLDIPGVDRDLERAELMMQRFGVASDDMVRLFNAEATVDAVERQFQHYSKTLQPHDQLYLYFSTHGLQLPDDNGDESDGRDEALALADFAIGLPTDAVAVSGALIDDRLAELLAALPNKHTFIIADTCNSGTISKSLSDELGDLLSRVGKFIQMPSWLRSTATHVADPALLAELAQPGVVMLSASADGELADIDEDGSEFTRALLATQENPEQDNAWCWFERARSRVRQNTGGVQWPQMSSDFEAAVAPLAGRADLMHGVSLLQNCSGSASLTTDIEEKYGQVHLTATAEHAGWVTAVSIKAPEQELLLQPQASRWHHGQNRPASLGRLKKTANTDSAAWVLWTADGVELPRHRGDFSVLWQALQQLPSDRWSGSLVKGVDIDAR